MEMYIFRPHDVARLYNCSNINIDDVPLEKRQHVVEGVISIVLCAIYYILYIPCMISIYRHASNSCYRLLFYISVTDLLILWQLGFVHGIMSIQGAVYCSYPNFLYFIGIGVTAIWAAESVSEAILAINRCTCILFPEVEKMLFEGRKTYIWLAVPTLYAFYWSLYMKPALYSGIYYTFLFNPYAGYIEDKKGIYVSLLHSLHDTADALVIPIIYTVFFILFFIKLKHMGSGKDVLKQKMMFLQIFVISALNFTACIIYVYLCYVSVSETLIHVCQWCWFHIHGLPPVIYLLLNKTIRSDCKSLLKRVFNRDGKSSSRTISIANRVGSSGT